MARRVLLPHPLGPRIEAISPLSNSKIDGFQGRDRAPASLSRIAVGQVNRLKSGRGYIHQKQRPHLERHPRYGRKGFSRFPTPALPEIRFKGSATKWM